MVVNFCIARRWLLLGLALLISIAAFGPARQLAFDRSVENMFAADDPLLAPYQRLKRTFGGNEIVLAVYVDPDLLHPDRQGIRRLAEISRRCEEVPGVRAVLSLDRPLGDAILWTKPIQDLFENYTHGSDGQTAAVVCMLDAEPDTTVPRQRTIDQLRGVVEHLPDGLPPGTLAGEPVAVADGFRFLNRDAKKLGFWCLILLGAAVVICFRSIRWLIIPLAVVQFTVLTTKALLVMSGLKLSMMSSMLTAVVTVIGVATVIHIIVRFRQARGAGLPPEQALLQTGALLAAPIFWACTTDAVGFAALTIARVGPVQDYGIMMATASLLVIVSVALLVPGLALLGRMDTDPHRAWGEQGLSNTLDEILKWVLRFPKSSGIFLASVALISAAGVVRLEVETDFTKNFRSNTAIVQSYRFIENRLGGAGVMDVILPAPEQLDNAYYQRVQILADRLRREVRVRNDQGEMVPGLTKVLSLSDALEPLGLGGFVGLAAMRWRLPSFTAALYGEDPQQPGRFYYRIMLRARERQSATAKKHIIDEVTRIAREEFPPQQNHSNAEVTGSFVLLTSLIESALRDQWRTFALAMAAIATMLSIAFRSLRLALIALIPNGFPIMIVLGVLGWLHLPVNLGVAMIAAVSLGLSVDSSIHYVISFQRARQAGQSIDRALQDVQQTVGRAAAFSILSLVVGFSVLCTSEFVPTIYFGALVSLAMLGGLFGNLVVLPLLLKLFCRA